MTQTITDFVAHHAVLAVFVLMAIDSVFPAGGELVMLFAGALAAGAVTNGHVVLLGADVATGFPAFIVLVITGTLGYLVGSWIGWLIGLRGGRELIERHGRWLHLGPDRFARAERWFDRFGSLAVFLGRLTPLVRSFISIPAGVFEAPFGRYTVLTAAASAIWCLVFAGAGWALGGNWDEVHRAFRYVDYAAVIAVIAVLALIVVRTRRRPAAG